MNVRKHMKVISDAGNLSGVRAANRRTPCCRFAGAAFVASAIGILGLLRGAEPQPVPAITVDELTSGVYPYTSSPSGFFSIAQDGRTISLRTSAPFYSNGLELLIDCSTGAIQDLSSDNVRWGIFQYTYRDDLKTFGKDGKIVGNVTVEGKSWAALRNLKSPDDPELLFRFPLAASCAYVGASGENMIFKISVHRGTMPRTRPEEDSPPVIDVKTRMRVHESYFPDVDRNPFVKTYPEAYANETRSYYVLFVPTTKELRRICSGNDSWPILHPSGRKMIVGQNRRGEDFKGVRGDRTSYADLYLLNIPEANELPLFDLEEAIKTDALIAGWSDHKGAIMRPVMAEIPHLIGMAWSPDGRMLSTGLRNDMTGEHRVGVIDLDKREVRDLTSGISLKAVQPRLTFGEEDEIPSDFGTAHRACWTSDSKALLVPRAGYLWRIPVNGDPVENLSAKAPGAIRKIAGVDPLTVTPLEFDGDILVVTTDEAKFTDGLARFNLRTGKVIPLVEDAGYISQASIGGNRDEVIYGAVKPETTVQVFARSLREAGVKPGRQVTHFKPEVMGRRLPPKKLLRFSAKDGEALFGLLYLPGGESKSGKWPLILVPEGFQGDSVMTYVPASPEGGGALKSYRAMGAQAYSRAASFFNRAGYAVLIFDLRIPGAIPTNRFPTDKTLALVTEIFEAAADAAVADGTVDKDKMAIIASSGNAMVGNFALAALAQSSRFKTGVVCNAIGLPFAQALWTDQEPWSRVSFMGRNIPLEVSPMKTPERYMLSAALPLFRSLKSPLLFMHENQKTTNGMEYAWSIPETRVHELFNSASLAGTKSVAAICARPMSHTERYARTLLWLNEHLRSGPAVAWRATLPRKILINEVTAESLDLEEGLNGP